MIKISKLLLGYREITFPAEDLCQVAEVMLKQRIHADFISQNTLVIAERDAKKLNEILDKNEGYKISDPKGFVGKIKSVKHLYAIFAALFLSVIILLMSSNIVWDVRIDSKLPIPLSAVETTLENLGLGIGKSWHRINKSEIENRFLNEYENVSWININRRGSVAYVSLGMREFSEDKNVIPTSKYANVVASRDCVIDEITVKRGTALVKPGDPVKKGDIIIRGIDVDGNLCLAEGNVKGRITETVAVEVAKKYNQIVYGGEKMQSLTWKIFGFSINILNFYGNSDTECDIIERKEVCSLFNTFKLPLEVITTYSKKRIIQSTTLSEAQMISMASHRLSEMVTFYLSNADLVNASTSGQFTNSGYRMVSKITLSTDISSTSYIHTEN